MPGSLPVSCSLLRRTPPTATTAPALPLTLGNGTKVSDHIHLRGNGYGQGYLQFDRPSYSLGESSDNQWINSGNGHYNDYSHIPGGQFNGIITWGKSTNWRVGCYVRNGRSARPT